MKRLLNSVAAIAVASVLGLSMASAQVGVGGSVGATGSGAAGATTGSGGTSASGSATASGSGSFTASNVSPSSPFGSISVGSNMTASGQSLTSFNASLSPTQQTELHQRCDVIIGNRSMYEASAVGFCTNYQALR